MRTTSENKGGFRPHDWQEYLDGKVCCAACGARRRRDGKDGLCSGVRPPPFAQPPTPSQG